MHDIEVFMHRVVIEHYVQQHAARCNVALCDSSSQVTLPCVGGFGKARVMIASCGNVNEPGGKSFVL